MCTGTALDTTVWYACLNILKILDHGACIQNDEDSTFAVNTVTSTREKGGEMAKFISKTIGQK